MDYTVYFALVGVFVAVLIQGPIGAFVFVGG